MSRETLTQIEGGFESINDWRDTTLVARMDSSGSADLSLTSVSAAMLHPRESGEINMSLGCYSCRTVSDLGEDIMFMGIPMARMPALIDGLENLGKKAIPDSRSWLYLPPLT
jgi:uncharacterized protein (DUF169 family)